MSSCIYKVRTCKNMLVSTMWTSEALPTAQSLTVGQSHRFWLDTLMKHCTAVRRTQLCAVRKHRRKSRIAMGKKTKRVRGQERCLSGEGSQWTLGDLSLGHVSTVKWEAETGASLETCGPARLVDKATGRLYQRRWTEKDWCCPGVSACTFTHEHTSKYTYQHTSPYTLQ